MQNAFEQISKWDQEKQEEKLNAYLDKLNDQDELAKEQDMLTGNTSAKLIGGKKKDEDSSLSHIIRQYEKNHTHHHSPSQDEDSDEFYDC